jgi:hypothetical protein
MMSSTKTPRVGATILARIRSTAKVTNRPRTTSTITRRPR